jgi:uncharacterized protein (DUF736 family)
MPEGGGGRNPDEIGALWEKQGADGLFYSGKVNGEPVVVFKNTRKAPGSNAPDWRVLKASAPRVAGDAKERARW